MIVVVTIAGTTGEAGFGGSAAGPVFKKAMSTALRRLGVPRDVPEEIEELVCKGEGLSRGKDEPEDLYVAKLSDPPSDEEMREARGEQPFNESPADQNQMKKIDCKNKIRENSISMRRKSRISSERQ